MDYNAIAQKYGAINSIPPASTASKPKMDYSALAQKFGGSTTVPASTTTAPAPTDSGGVVGGFLKGLVSAPATLIARPFQLGAEALGASDQQVNDFTQKYGGGIVAPTPQNASDVVKDFGRGVQTVALGTGAPLATGAAFGFGSALENQGSNALTTGEGLTNTLTSTLVGLGLGKALDLVGKPLLNAAGKVVGTITPKILQDVASKGAGAVTNFMAQHELLGGVAKPLSEKITAGAESFDKGVGKLFTGTGNAVKGAVQSQYPGATSENVAKHYQNIEVNRLMEPTKTPGAAFRNASEVAKDAERRGIDLKKLAADNKIYTSDLIAEGKFSTADTANALRDEAMSGGKDILRPALAAADPGVQKIPLSDVRNEIMSRLNKVPDAKLSPQQKLKFAKNIAAEYGDGSITAAAHPDGYSLTNLYDSKLQTSSNLYKGPKNGGVQTISDNLTSQQKQIESQVFGDLLKKNAPKELNIDAYMKAQEGRFILADYLQSLDTKKAPQTLFQRGVKRAAQLGGATTGASVAGPFGMFSGYQFGGIVADTFANASNPVKVAFLKSIGKTEPEIYSIMKEFTSDANIAKELRKTLPAGTRAGADLTRAMDENGAIRMNHPVYEPNKFNNDMTHNLQREINTQRLPAPSTIYKGPTQDNIPYTPNRLFKTTPVVETKKAPRIFKGKK